MHCRLLVGGRCFVRQAKTPQIPLYCKALRRSPDGKDAVQTRMGMDAGFSQKARENTVSRGLFSAEKEVHPPLSAIRYYRENTLGIELILSKSACLSYPLHNHVSTFVLGIVLEGAFTLTLQNTPRRYGRNQTFSVPPYAPHKLAIDAPCTLLCLCLNKSAPPDSACLFPLLHQALPLEHRQIGLLLAEYQRAQQLAFPNFSPATPVGALVERLEKYPERRCRLAEMARNVFLSQYHLLRTFKQTVGLTPHQFQLQNRIRKAQRLLSERHPIAETALAAGFCDQSHFMRHFKRCVALTPAAYRQAIRRIVLPAPLRRTQA